MGVSEEGSPLVQGPTIGVLSTSFGGAYFGGLLGAIATGVAAVDGRLVAIQTFDAGTFEMDVNHTPPFQHEVAWDYISGFIVLLDAVNTDYMKAARASGRPVVVVSDDPAGFSCPIVHPDNHGGARLATRHLIEHGHRRIAFVGHLGQKDVRERYEAYQATLIEHGLEPDPALFFNAGSMQSDGGARAARAMIAAGMPSTAVLTANDLNAIGVMRLLAAAGYQLPADQAVIGFDDTDEGAYLIPGLTSVRQPVEEIGGHAVGLLLQLIAGQDVPFGPNRVSTSLTIRESCGCPSALANVAPAAEPEYPEGTEADLLTQICTVLRARFSEDQQARLPVELRECVQVITNALEAALAGVPGPESLHLRQALMPLSDVLDSNQNMMDIMRLVRRYGRRRQVASGQDAVADVVRRVEDCLQQIFILLAQAHTAVQVELGKSMMASLSTQYGVSMDLLRSQERDPRSLDWLRKTAVRGGCLGLWPAAGSESNGRESLNLVGVFDRDIANSQRSAERLDIAAFPPADVMAMADVAVDDMVYVANLKVGTGDWGMLAIVGPIQARHPAGRETMNQWAALLSVALEYEAILQTLREQEEHLRRAALYDELTGLPNRAYFQNRLTLAMARSARRTRYRYAMLLLDLDGFKVVNDSLGHLAGDRLLQQVASRISAGLRMIDTAARLGGDEFAILLEEIHDVAAAVASAERLQAALSAPYDLGTNEVVVTASIGIALGRNDYDDTDNIIRDADVAMYHAKSSGKGTHAVFDPSMHASAVERLRTEGELRLALENGELELHYQPIVDLQTGVASGAEALIRWRHPTRGLLPPAEFLAVAEESGLILPIGNWVFDEACRQMKAWRLDDEEAVPFVMSLNVSNRQFWRGEVMDSVGECLKRWGLDPGRLAIEITEGVVMHDVKLACTMLNGLHLMGVQVHVDDFGTGYSSLEALHDLPIDALKIDRSFVSRLATSARSRELVRAIVTMGLNLNLAVIAEGIETISELEYVRELGCTHGQGYLYSRPVPAGPAQAFISGRPLAYEIPVSSSSGTNDGRG
jgi:diguanylate cyclase (GGDEF)-like protein